MRDNNISLNVWFSFELNVDNLFDFLYFWKDEGFKVIVSGILNVVVIYYKLYYILIF